MATYATLADALAYTEGLVIDDTPAAERILVRAERQVDQIVGPYEVEDNGLKFGVPGVANEKGLEADQVAALKYAVCAQFEYRIEMGERFFTRDQYDSNRGPDFSASGRLSRIGPKVWEELQGTGLLELTGTVGGGRADAPWRSFAVNTDY